MKRTFTYSDDKSNKFWTIETCGNEFTVTYGKIGTAGQTSSKTFDSEEKCDKETEKLIAEKLKKGYVEGDASAVTNTSNNNNYLEEWQQIVDADDKAAALVNHFSYLIDTPGREDELKEVLEKTMSKIIEVSIEGNRLMMKFDDEMYGEMSASAPAQKINPKYPESFRKCLQKHEHIHNEDAMFDLAVCCVEDIGDIDEEEWEEWGIKNNGNLVCPVWDYSDCWFYHPKKKNDYGQPVLCYLCHEGGEPEGSSYNLGSVFLYRWAEILDVDGVDFERGDFNIS